MTLSWRDISLELPVAILCRMFDLLTTGIALQAVWFWVLAAVDKTDGGFIRGYFWSEPSLTASNWDENGDGCDSKEPLVMSSLFRLQQASLNWTTWGFKSERSKVSSQPV